MLPVVYQADAVSKKFDLLRTHVQFFGNEPKFGRSSCRTISVLVEITPNDPCGFFVFFLVSVLILINVE